MAVFNPDPGFGSPPSWQGASHGVIPNTGAAAIVEGLSDAVRGVAKVADYNIQQNIRNDVNNIFDATNAAAGLDERARAAVEGVEAVAPACAALRWRSLRSRSALRNTSASTSVM